MIAVIFVLFPVWQPRVLEKRSPPSDGVVDAYLPEAVQIKTHPLPEALRFEHITSQDGLSQDTVYFIFQDRKGFLWLGTQDGLNRYDGYGFRIYRNNPANPNSLSHNTVLCMAEDADGMLWFGTQGGGLNRYDPRTETFTRYVHSLTLPTSLSDNTVTALYADPKGRLWVGTMGGGLNLFDSKTESFIRYRAVTVGFPVPTGVYNRVDAETLSSDFISAILPDPSGDLWLGTGGYGNEGNGVERFNPLTGKSILYQFKPSDRNTLSGNTISALALDANGMLWVGTGGHHMAGRGINRLDTHTGQVTRFQHNADDSSSLGSNDVMSLAIDTAGTLWIGTWGGGLDRLDTGSDKPRFIHYRQDPYTSYSLSGNNILTIFQDRTGILWFGSTVGGLNKINPMAQRFQLYRNNPLKPVTLGGNAVGPMIEDHKGTVWVGTLGAGLDRFHRTGPTFSHFIVWRDNPLHEQANTYNALLEDRSGSIWAGTQAGLAQFDPDIGSFVYFYHDPRNPDSLSSDRVSDLAEDASGRLWMSTQDGLDWFDRQSKRFIHMDIPQAGTGTDIFLDPSGYLWLGTQGKGLFRLDLSTVSGNSVKYTWYYNIPDEPESLGDNTVLHINMDKMGNLWFATGHGLDRLDGKTSTFTHYRMEHGLVSNTVYCVLADDQDNLWISTNAGITRFDQRQGNFRTFDARDGLQGSEFHPRSCLRASDGALFFGGVNGLTGFMPQEIQDNPYPPPVAVTGFRIYNEPAVMDLSGKTPIRLSYQQDFITFEFVALDFHVPQKNQLMYKLDGIDKDWVKADIGRYASYTNLPGGNYVFRVRGSNNDGVWNEEAVAIPVLVATPFWEEDWFLAGGALFVTLVILTGVHAYLENIHSQNRRLEELVQQRTTTLRQTNERLHQEILQREKVEAALAHKAAEDAVAAERSRLARDLHDAVTQTLFSASLTAEVLPDLWQVDPDEAQKSTEDLRQLTRGALAEMRTLLLELRPAALTQARYEDLLRQLADAVIGRSRLPIELNITGQRSLPPDVQVALYRIAQETLNNIVKYAKASKVCVELQMSQAGLLLSIRDDGVGFDPATIRPTSMGMRIMRERAEGIGADLTILSEPGKGTLVEVAWHEIKIKELV